MVNNVEHSFDHLILGGGLAGMQLALAMLEDHFFADKQIAIIEARDKNENDKTWCFWEKDKGYWEKLIFKKWSKGKVISHEKTISLEMGEYEYKMIRSLDFYKYVKARIEAASNFKWIQDEIIDIDGTAKHAQGRKANYSGEFLYDSTIHPEHDQSGELPKVLQHFKGWLIQTKDEIFDPNLFTMSDFRLAFNEKCSFTYILPINSNEALIEYTFFSAEIEKEETYDRLIREYIEKYLDKASYVIKESEKGVIPMSSFPYHEGNLNRYIKIGTAGGWVKASTGYSFKNTEKKVAQLIDNIKRDRPLTLGLRKARFGFYDRIFLRILQKRNELGNKLLEQMYANNSAHEIFKFLDEESSWKEEINLISKFEKGPFLWSLHKELFV